MVEHQLPKLAFAGSIPVSRSKQEFAVTMSRLFLCRRAESIFRRQREEKVTSASARANFVWKTHRTVQVQGISR